MEAVSLIVDEGVQYLSRLFENSKYLSPNGSYCVWLWDSNLQISPVVVDDRLPFDDEDKPVYTDSAPYIWLMLLEKALAKKLGGYHRLYEATCMEVVGFLTGSPFVQGKTPKFVQKALRKLKDRGKYDRVYVRNREGKLLKVKDL